MEYPIDFVVTWLDSNDPKWQEDFRKYKGITTTGDQSKARYRDWDLFKYWFRAVENYAPWVNKVYLITNGTFPKWINPKHPKLVLVKHSDYIPEQFLPTFNSRTIEFYMNRIEGLSEHFVYFNDDMYINAPVNTEYYFQEGLPCDCNSETFFNVPKYNPIDRFNIILSMMVDIGVLNAHFNRREVIKQSSSRWFGVHLGKTGLLNSIYMTYSKSERFVGFNWKHVEQPYLKSIFDEIWKKEEGLLSESSTRFRGEATLNPYIFRYWQFATNKFHPASLKHARKYRLVKEHIPMILHDIHDSDIKSLCINDTPLCTDDEYVQFKDAIHRAFEKKLPNKSSFEI